MSSLEWWSAIGTLVGVGLTLIGVAVTLRQVFKTKQVAEAARDAVQDTARQFYKYKLTRVAELSTEIPGLLRDQQTPRAIDRCEALSDLLSEVLESMDLSDDDRSHLLSAIDDLHIIVRTLHRGDPANDEMLEFTQKLRTRLKGLRARIRRPLTVKLDIEEETVEG